VSSSINQNQSQTLLLTGQSYFNLMEGVDLPFSILLYINLLRLHTEYRKAEDCKKLLQGDPRLIQAQIIDYIISLREELRAVTIYNK
jgi:hypothetical protein